MRLATVGWLQNLQKNSSVAFCFPKHHEKRHLCRTFLCQNWGGAGVQGWKEAAGCLENALTFRLELCAVSQTSEIQVVANEKPTLLQSDVSGRVADFGGRHLRPVSRRVACFMRPHPDVGGSFFLAMQNICLPRLSRPQRWAESRGNHRRWLGTDRETKKKPGSPPACRDGCLFWFPETLVAAAGKESIKKSRGKWKEIKTMGNPAWLCLSPLTFPFQA